MTGRGAVAGEVALGLAESAPAAGSASARDIATMRLLRERLGATFVACYRQRPRGGKAPTVRLRASDAGVSHAHPILIRAARAAARAWMATGAATPCALDDP